MIPDEGLQTNGSKWIRNHTLQVKNNDQKGETYNVLGAKILALGPQILDQKSLFKLNESNWWGPTFWSVSILVQPNFSPKLVITWLQIVWFSILIHFQTNRYFRNNWKWTNIEIRTIWNHVISNSVGPKLKRHEYMSRDLFWTGSKSGPPCSMRAYSKQLSGSKELDKKTSHVIQTSVH